MPTARVLTPPTAQAEPVSLALLNATLRLDLDPVLLAGYEAGTLPEGADPAVVAQLDLLALLRSGAREKVEAFTGCFFAAQTVAYTFALDEPYQLPAGAAAESVAGVFTDLAALAELGNYLEEYRKGISVNREWPWGAALQQTYTVTAVLDGQQVPSLARIAMVELAGEWYRNPETTLAGVNRLTELPVNWKVKLAHLVVAPWGAPA